MTGHEWAAWAGRLSYHVEALLDESGPDWLREQRRDKARQSLANYEEAVARPVQVGYDDETRNLRGLAS